MNSGSFFVAAVGFVVLSFFVYYNYPLSWRENQQFRTILLIWHIVGAASLVTVFTVFSRLTHEGIRHEVVHIATYYYLVTMLMVFLYAIRLFVVGLYRRYIHVVRHGMGDSMRRFILDNERQSVILLCIAFAMCTFGYFNIDVLHPTTYDVTVDKPSAEDELTICLIADIHAGAGTWDYTYDDMVELVNDSQADVLLIAGDAFDETTSGRDVKLFGRALEEVRQPRYGTFFIYGNHDDATEDWAAEQMRAFGVQVLEDERVTLGEDIQLVGRMDPKHNEMEMGELLATQGVDVSRPVLVLTHRPADFRKMAELGCDLAMAGHTHGFNIPMFLGSTLFGDMYYGIAQYGQMTAITTSGVSAWGFHYKFPAISEVVTVHVHFVQ